MISYGIYKILHFVGVFMVIVSLGSLALHVMNGGTREHKSRKWAAMFHGIGMLLSLVAGFGLLARIGVMHGGLPGWAYAKLIVWFILGGLPALIYRKPQFAKLFWILVLAFAVLNGYLALYKPF